jgi:hypothetical protein
LDRISVSTIDEQKNESEREAVRQERREHRQREKELREKERSIGISAADVKAAGNLERANAKAFSGQNHTYDLIIKDPFRRRDCLADFELFCKTYGELAFFLPWAEVHRESAATIQKAATYGGWHAYGEPRGSGKTTRATWAGLWAILGGGAIDGRNQHDYLPIIGANQDMAISLVALIYSQLAHNDLLHEDFPHVCAMIRELDGEPRKQKGQRYEGIRTQIEISSQRIRLPWIPCDENPSAGRIIESYGLESAIRGLVEAMPDGSIVRPTFAICDDPQTRESAKSPSQTRTRMEILHGDVAFLAGPTSSMSMVCPCTIIYKGDLADQILDRKAHPEWHGKTTKMVLAFPTNQKLWDQYEEISRSSTDEDFTRAIRNAFYEKNRHEMDIGHEIYWPERVEPGDISAIQSAMNFKIRDEAAFYAECQNSPLVEQNILVMLTADQISEHVMGYNHGVVPADCTVLTAFADVQQDYLFWMICGWTPTYTGYVIDYGAWPDQGVAYFSRRGARVRLSGVYPGDDPAIMYAALTDLAKNKIFKEYDTVDNRKMTVDRWCIDGGWASRVPATETWIAQSQYRKQMAITRGRYIGAKNKLSLSASKKARDQKRGAWEWYWDSNQNNGGWIFFNANFWKMRVHNALLLELGAVGSLQLFKASPATHRMLGEHCTAERADKVQVDDNVVYEFTEIPNRDNEGFDALVGCMLGAQTMGITSHSERIIKRVKPRSSMASMAARARGKSA